jgi:hypothetical protein
MFDQQHVFSGWGFQLEKTFLLRDYRYSIAIR